MTVQSILLSYKKNLIIASAAFFFVQFLFFLDEGFYDFRWMSNIGNWIIFLIYTTVVFGLMWLISDVLLKNYTGPGRIVLSIMGGITLTIGILYLMVQGIN